ncbi:discoidin domain-containing protein [Sphingomonas sp. RHCKR7]|uniref:MGH1-like glycoside hydrolase domain-containing protein n=1 Tax=Sphingomonas folli TaxID=2862497 RepID=UPI001C66FE0E|nr:discoidin domain-containing protein [Sphingomonas folli]MBW6527084.1 discoidin domain-containing protein [Sphingomonas folli]
MIRTARRLVAAALLLAAPAQAIDADRVARERFGNDAPWYRDRIPFFESADARLDSVYYYRWQLYRAHQRDLGERGYISTEFLDDVSWQLEPWASLNDATGFHLGEGRWLRDRRFADDYIAHMYAGGNDRHFTDYMADSVWGRYLVDGDRAAATRHLAAMRGLYDAWDDHRDPAKRLYWVEPLLDATEYTISSIDASGGKDGFRGGDSFRPSVNSYMFANARALSRLYALAGDRGASADFAARAATIKALVQRDLWSRALGHFIDRYKVENQYVRYWAPIRGRELVGYVPWTFDLPDDDARFAAAWRHVLSRDELGGAAGPRTVEPSYPHYMRQYRYEGSAPECQWNGPSWPFQTTQLLLGMANVLDHYDQRDVSRSAYLRLLRQYAGLHYQGDRLDLEEDYHPDTGRPIVGLARSHHYFHSGFVDLVLGGLVGIRPQADDTVAVNPLLPAVGDPQALAWFRVQDVPYHGHRLDVTWDADGRHYGERGLTVELDGRRLAHRATLGRLTVAVPRAAPAPIARPIDRAVQLVRGQFPNPSASSGTAAENLHDAVDGRVWFFPELPNGWSSDGGGPQWFAVDLGKPTRLERAELAFFADDARFAAPRGYKVQAWDGARWQDLAARGAAPVANGITHATWRPIIASRVRVLFDVPPARSMRLAEIKLF